jgi:hypothetical protein
MNYGLQEFKFEQGRFLSASIRIYLRLSAVFISIFNSPLLSINP